MNNIFSYIFNDKTHSDTSLEYMTNLGMDETAIQAVLSLRNFDKTKVKELQEQDCMNTHSEWMKKVAIGSVDAYVYEAYWMNAVHDLSLEEANDK